MVTVIKANGEKEPFSEEKVKSSILRAGIKEELVGDVLTHIKSSLYENIPTSKIYNQITDYLNSSQPYVKSKYSLKRAIMDMGPTGYPFEDFVAEVLKREGYETEVSSILPGKCVKHEVDVIAEKEGKRIMIEAKFHHDPGIRTELHVSLYTKARFDDLKEQHRLDEAWIVTNTKMSIDAVSYALCANMKVVTWSFPENAGLRDLVEKWKLHPITALSSLSHSQKQVLMENHIVLCKDVIDHPEFLELLYIPDDRKAEIIDEAKSVCSS